jgi:pimeloyl-ACP methyl ester carboxylesterase
MTRVKWVANFGGAHTGMSFLALIRRAVVKLWTSPHYTLREMVRALRAIGATQARVLPKLAWFDLLARDLQIRVPLAIFQGRLDAVAPPQFAAALAARLGTSVIELERSAHMPYDEEPERFRAELLRFIHASGERRVATVPSLVGAELS